MTSKLRQRCTTMLTCSAIIILIAVIVTVWVLLGQGAFKSVKRHHQHRLDNATVTTTTTISTTTTNKGKEYIEKSHLEDIDADVEFVKPIKISPLPLHHHDIIFDQLSAGEGVDFQKPPPLRHHSGHFRHRQAEIWDPHPRYVINAFGKELFLELGHNKGFVVPDLHISHVFDNYTLRMRHDPKSFGCFYSGKIRDEVDSDVAVSLCNGMTGYISTPQYNYYIEPAEKSPRDPLGSFLHRIKKVPHRSEDDDRNDNEVVRLFEPERCQIEDNNTIIEDDFFSEVISMPSDSHVITKRHILFSDDIENTNTLRRPRDADWPDNDHKTNEYFVKVLVVVDKTMVSYHLSEDDLNDYILTMMSHVSLLFKDASIGNSISLSVVDIWKLKDTTFTFPNSQEMLRKFCAWQKHHSPEPLHNVALLLTRDSICKDSTITSCNTLGVAEVSSMCNPSASCSIVRDRGLSSSYTIAHELGHILSMPHDDIESCLLINKGSKNDNVMRSMLNNETKPWKWSECSKYYLTEFLESNKVKCLTEPPYKNQISSKFAQVFPGETFEANRQCALEFGHGHKLCNQDGRQNCRSLWCTSEAMNGSCKSNLLPWADGTPCGQNYWCHHGECIPLNRELLVPVAGGWGEWQSWSECSRTCGGGVKKSRRVCDAPIPQNGGPYCTGHSVKYISCNSQPCENDSDFRGFQCAQFNGINKNIPNLTSSVQWVPKYGLDQKDDYCKLYCRPKSSNAYYLLEEKVIDGTKCGLNSFDICVNGICKPGGCDNQLNSKVVLDECGVCGGDNSKCREIAGKYNILQTGFHNVVRIPKGSSNLDIRQNANNDSNYLVLIDGETGNFILNSKTQISPQQKDVIFGGVLISYSGSSAAVERITTPKNHRLGKDLVLGVLSVGTALHPDITFRYIVSQENAPRYGWRLYRKHWTKCNSICSGFQYMNPICVELATNKEQPEHFCSSAEREHQRQKQECNTHCQLRWNDVSRGPCSVNCGTGVRNVYYNCVKVELYKEKSKSHHLVVDEKHCSILPEPPSLESCHGSCESTRWDYTEWSECSVSCGSGVQRRSAKCVENTGRELDDSLCFNTEKITSQLCNNQKCPVWTSREWTPCSVTCGRGYKTKPYFCNLDGKIYHPSACDPQKRRIEKEECIERPCAGWSTGVWNECSKTCGDGVQTRRVFCENLDDHQEIQEEFCRDILKPNDTQKCNRGLCNNYDLYNEIVDNSIDFDSDFKWITGKWSRCSKSCESGISSRLVICRNDYGDEGDIYCQHLQRPVSTIECNTHQCPSWNFGQWSDCDSSCEKRRQVSCRNATGNYVEDSQCDSATKPETTSKCKISQCSSLNLRSDYFSSKENLKTKRYNWKVGRWKQCSTTCGRGFRRRHIECEDTLNKVILVDQYCASVPKPRDRRPCERFSCKYTWIEEDWSQCSATCGDGVKERNVTCHRVFPGGIVDPNPLSLSHNKLDKDGYCDVFNKPSITSRCNVVACAEIYVWKVEPWKQCSSSCGRKGRQIRFIHCIDKRSGNQVPKHFCKSKKPRRKRKCNQWKCVSKSCKEIQQTTNAKENQDYVMQVGGRLALVYCYKMDTSEPEEFISLNSESTNFAENYDRRLKNPHSCPRDGERHDECDCLEVGPERSGITMFWKVRLNVTSLKIIGDDFTFSRQNRGSRVSYGSAGDCYSSVEGCAQGRFSIDLRGTSFKVSEKVRWLSIGKFATAQIHKSEQNIDGRCGGYCGNCIADTNLGLQVEVT